MNHIIASLSLIWLAVVVAVAAQGESPEAVLDTLGQPLQRGVDYYIKPAITDNGGRFTVIDRNSSGCPRYAYAGQENVSGLEGFAVNFAPFEEGENVVRETKNFKVSFSANFLCYRSTTWRVADEDHVSGRRLIILQDDGSFSNYFYIGKQEGINGNIYNIQWCPAELCPTCRFICGTIGAVVENGKRLLALDGSVLPVVFERA